MLRWSLMLFALSVVEGMGHAQTAAGSPAIAKISFILAISLFVIFHHERKVQ
jgi:uncharacterized membrane protein YtjA (UPF0391 family)